MGDLHQSTGIDLSDPAKVQLVRAVTLQFFAAKARQLSIEPDDLVQQVLVAIVVRNRGRCPYRPLKGYTEKPYIYRVAWQTLGRMADKRARWYDIELHDTHDSLCAAARQQGAFGDDLHTILAAGSGHLWETRTLTKKKSQTFRKDDGKKPRFDLLDAHSQLALVEVLTVGAVRYGDRNYLNQGATLSRYEAALQRHLNAYRRGEYLDPDTGRPHLAHVMANCQILMELRRDIERRGTGEAND